MEARQAVIKAAMVTTTTAHVLAVDDDPSVRQMIADYLTDNDVLIVDFQLPPRSQRKDACERFLRRLRCQCERS